MSVISLAKKKAKDIQGVAKIQVAISDPLVSTFFFFFFFFFYSACRSSLIRSVHPGQ